VRDDKIPIEQSAVRWSEDDLSGFLPAPRLLEILGAHWSGYDFDFVDASGSLIAFSPYTGRSGGSGPLFVQKAALLSALRATGWNIIWALVGDRSCMERSVGVTHVTDGETRFSAVYWLESEKLSGGLTRTDFITYPVRSDRDELLSKLIARDR